MRQQIPDLDSLSQAELVSLVRQLLSRVDALESEQARLQTENRQLREENRLLREENAGLQRKKKRPHAPFSRGTAKANPKKPGRKPGDSHGSHTRRASPKTVHETIDVAAPDVCPDCGGRTDSTGQCVDQYQEDIEIRLVRRHFRLQINRCCNCYRRVQGRHELQTSDAIGACQSQVGSIAQSMIVYLKQSVGTSYGKIMDFMTRVMGLSITRGACAQIVLRAGRKCQAAFVDLLKRIRTAEVVNPDETGWRTAASPGWLWVFPSKDLGLTVCAIRRSRGSDVIEEILGADYCGQIGHDGWSPYEKLVHATHQQCLTHLLGRCRRLIAAANGGAVRFPRFVKSVLQQALTARDRRDAGEISLHGSKIVAGQLRVKLEPRLIKANFSHAGNETFANFLLKHLYQLFSFLEHPDLDAANWRGEQSIRPAVINRKIWGGNRTRKGADAEERLQSIRLTCQQQQIDFFKWIGQVIRARPGLAPPLIL